MATTHAPVQVIIDFDGESVPIGQYSTVVPAREIAYSILAGGTARSAHLVRAASADTAEIDLAISADDGPREWPATGKPRSARHGELSDASV